MRSRPCSVSSSLCVVVTLFVGGCAESQGSTAEPAATAALEPVTEPAPPAATPANDEPKGPPRPGAVAPSFTLPVAGEDRQVSLAEELLQNQLTVVLFIATQCPYSNAYNERMAAMAKAYAAAGVGFVGINSNKSEPVEEIVAHAKQHGFSFPVLKDANNVVADQYAATKTPEAFVVDAAGKLLYHGRIDESYEDAAAVKEPDLKNALDAALAGKPVPAATTKAFGCSIKRV